MIIKVLLSFFIIEFVDKYPEKRRSRRVIGKDKKGIRYIMRKVFEDYFSEL